MKIFIVILASSMLAGCVVSPYDPYYGDGYRYHHRYRGW